MSKYLIVMIIFLLLVVLALDYFLMKQSKSAIITLMQTRMLDISNTAAAMIDGDALEKVTPADEGEDDYENIMQTLTYFQDNIELKYIYCIRDMGDGTFTFGLDPTVEDPGEFGSPIVYTDALYEASQGTASADDEYYEDAWGKFYSAYSPVFDSEGNVAGIIAVDFSAEWYDEQIAAFTRTAIIVSILALLVGGGIVIAIIAKSDRKIGSIHGQLNKLETTLMQEMGNDPTAEASGSSDLNQDGEQVSMDGLEKRIQTIQSELQTQIAQVHGQAYRDGLTGVKSKHAYLEMEDSLEGKMQAGALSDLAIVVCDVNGLKKINDTLGHKAGDEYIKKACAMVCEIFAHSPVYRIGGDEFVVILRGKDYDNRTALMHELHNRSVLHISTQGAVVSGGAAEYQAGQDQSIQDVFERADSAMYKEKMLLKELGAESREDESETGDPDFDDLSLLHVRKHILIADDVATNREILGDVLQEDYEVFYASDGVETMEILREYKDKIDLLLLDLYMPNMSGREVMKEMQIDEDLMSIPVIVLTVDQEAELDSLRVGAMDFIPKPYPDIEIIKARVAKCIELSENRDLIRYTQKDKLTGLFNYDYFIRYVNRFDQQYSDMSFDAIVCDTVRFRDVNEQYGWQFGDLVLHSIGSCLKKFAWKTGGIGCRKSGATFLLYCPHQEDYEQLFRKFLEDVFVEKDTAEKVTLKFGVVFNADQEEDVEKRFLNAKAAAESVKDDPQAVCGVYQEEDI